MSRIQTTFSRLASEQRAALIPFVTAGFPSPALTVPLMHAMVAAGVDVIELGVPFSDPMADGPSIQRASEKALAQGMRLSTVLAQVTEFLQQDPHTPVVLMGYANPIEAMGVQKFAAAGRRPAWMGCWWWITRRKRQQTLARPCAPLISIPFS